MDTFVAMRIPGGLSAGVGDASIHYPPAGTDRARKED